MSEPRLISPLLDDFALGGPISEHSGVICYPAMRNNSDERFIVKTISIPASQIQVDALLLTGAFSGTEAASGYFEDLANGIRNEVEILNKLSQQRGFLPYHNIQIVPKDEGIGFDVWLLSPYGMTLDRYLKRSPMTHLSAINLGIDLCAAMVVCREAGYLYVDLKPGNIFLPGHQDYRIGDLGFIRLDSLKYASLPDRYRSLYTPPEVADAYSTLNDTMDTYALGLVLYQIYNNGQLPFDSEEAKQALMDRLAAGESLPAPANADYEMAQIIEKACARNPEDRWASPAEMGHALISYMQRNGANDTPIVPPVIPEPEPIEEEPEETPEADEEAVLLPDEEAETSDAPEEEAAEFPDEAEAPAEELPGEIEAPMQELPEETETLAEKDAPAVESVDENAPTEDVVEDSIDEAPTQEAPAEDWIDRMDAILAEDEAAEETAAPENQPTLRELLEGDSLDEEAAADLDDAELSDDTIGMLTLAQELIDHDAPAPVVAPEPIEVPIPEPIVLEDETPEDTATSDTAEEAPADSGEDASEEPIIPIAVVPAYADDDAAVQEADSPKPSKLKKALGIIAALLVVAMLGAGAFYYYNEYYLQQIDSIVLDGVGNQLTVTVQTEMDQNLLTVICKDTYGNVLPGKLENGSVTFKDLLPGTQYMVTLEVEGFHKLVNAAPATYSTPVETKFINLSAVTGQEDGSVILSFGVEGADSDSWTLSWASADEQMQSMEFTGHSVTVTGLTVGSTYVFTLEAPEEIYLVGENTIEHTASQLIIAENLTVSGYSDGSITASWTAPEGVTVERWIARCWNEDGYDQILEVSDPSATFTDITANAAYTLEVTASGMIMGTHTYVTANPITVTDVTTQLVDGGIEVRWSYEGQTPAGGWLLLFTADGSLQQTVSTDETSVVMRPAVPGCHYDIVIQTPDATSVFGDGATLDVPDGKAFSAYGLDTNEISVATYALPEKTNWGSADLRNADSISSFAPGDSMALLYSTRSRYNIDYTTMTTLFVIHDADGAPISVSSSSRTWADMWYNGYCVETVDKLPAEPGSYTLTVYINGMKLTIQEFTIE